MAKKAKKVNVKEVAKMAVMEIITNTLEENGYTVKSGENFGMTKGTIVVSGKICDVQIKPIVPKTGIDRYKELEEEEEA